MSIPKIKALRPIPLFIAIFIVLAALAVHAQTKTDLKSDSFLSAVVYSSGGIFANSVAVADVNGDGKPDLIVANGYDVDIPGNGGVGILLGNGDGTFQPAFVVDTGGRGSFGNSVAIADVNGDGKPDLVVVNMCIFSFCSEGSSVAVRLGNGNGTFQPVEAYRSGAGVGGGAWSVKVADVNMDGKLDLIVTNSDGSVGILLGNGDGTFQQAHTYGVNGVGINSVAVADVNGDG
jgi:hypothetical protein